MDQDQEAMLSQIKYHLAEINLRFYLRLNNNLDDIKSDNNDASGF